MVIFIALTGIAFVALMIGFFGIRLPFLGGMREEQLLERELKTEEKKEANVRIKIINRATDTTKKDQQAANQAKSIMQKFKQVYDHK